MSDRRRSRSRSPRGGAKQQHRQRQYRRKEEGLAAPRSAVHLEAEALARIEAAVAERLATALASPAFQERVAARLREERTRLEEAMTAQLDAEKAALLERKRAAQEAARRAAEDLDRLLEENRRKVEEAQLAAARAAEAAAGNTAAAAAGGGPGTSAVNGGVPQAPPPAAAPARVRSSGLIVVDDP
ncbi:hypothetical protein Rsub_12219 [Raphidocelis subcapitata]|uniref:Uncharacterized protein n=1 Tax=Raphidocelis subcapitata TaxID=307507 RepID=A0A2V0PJR0_9CHLO|nr:hypothetical protein Rsub_12219 [Raphidocelis subcapitata]|eukprot:GBF99779.1 hypothetical protein Rsub_12219 [Raphidocelis subcapitata]